jgi:hypothetical protein
MKEHAEGQGSHLFVRSWKAGLSLWTVTLVSDPSMSTSKFRRFGLFACSCKTCTCREKLFVRGIEGILARISL